MGLSKKYRIGILATHPIQYYVPWYQALSRHFEIELKVFYCHHQTPEGQAKAGFGVPFDWDIPLLEGYEYQFLNNRAYHPNVFTFFGCDTPEISRIIAENSFDAFIVHGWYMKSFWQAIMACRRTQTPIMVYGDSQLLTQRSLTKRLLKYPFYSWFIPRFDAYLIVGNRAKEYYLHYGADEKKMFFVPHAVNNDFFSSSRLSLEPERENLSQEWRIPKDSIVFLFVGKLIPKKRPHDFIKTLNMTQKNLPQIFGLIVGDGPLRSELETFSNNSNLLVTFTGFLNQKEMPKAYTVSDVLVLPSDGGETWGLVVNEAMASGLPAIVSDKVGCVPDLIYPGETGEVFTCGDIERLAKIFADIALRKEHLREMGKKAHKIIENYSINNAVGGVLKAIHFIAKN